ncbi:MAG: YdeI/OmpD-associated family protein [Gaiellaceae bacterium]
MSSRALETPRLEPWVAFNGLSYTPRRDSVEWITEAKRDETRQRRLLRRS